MSQRLLFAVVVLLAATAIGLALFWHPQMPGATEAKPPVGGDFVLQADTGPVDTRSLRGKVVLVFFGYTYCPDICPTSLTTIGNALRMLTPAELDRVTVMFVSVDPERDTPSRLRDYVQFFHPSIVGVTGSAEEVAKAAKLYGAIYARQNVPSIGYVIDHSGWTYVLAPDGQMVARLEHGISAERLVGEIRPWIPTSPSSKGSS
jgi:protein SCO1/2